MVSDQLNAEIPGCTLHYHIRRSNRCSAEYLHAKNAATGNYEYKIPVTLAANDVIKYSFTYFNEATGGATDTAQVSYTYGQGGGENPATLSAPTFSPGAGTYTSAQNVTISAVPIDAAIYYTTDGSAPTRQSALYTGAIQVSQSQTLKAIAVKTGYFDSPAAISAYSINTGGGGCAGRKQPLDYPD